MLTISQVVNEVHDEFSTILFLGIFVFGYILLIIMLPLKGKNLIVSIYFITDSSKNRTFKLKLVWPTRPRFVTEDDINL